MSESNLVLEITAKNDLVRIARGRQTVIATLSPDNKVLTWKDVDMQSSYHKSVSSFLMEEKIFPQTILIDGLVADVLPANTPAEPEQHPMQGDLTPDYLEWLMKHKPVQFTVSMGVELMPLKKGEKAPDDIRERWRREDVIRTDTRPVDTSQGGEYISTKFRMKNQIIARRASHLTFTRQEIYRGDNPSDVAQPYKDPHHPIELHKMDKRGDVEIVSVKHASATAGSAI